MIRFDIVGLCFLVASMLIVVNTLYPHAMVTGFSDIFETVGSAVLSVLIDTLSWPIDLIGYSSWTEYLRTVLLPASWNDPPYGNSIMASLLVNRKIAGPHPETHFFSAGIALAKSNVTIFVFVILGILLAIMSAQTFQELFFGELRNVELDTFYDNIGVAVMESFFAMALFRDEYDVNFIARFVFLIILKSFHWIIESRVDYMDEFEDPPSRVWLLRVYSVFALIFTVDTYMIYSAVDYTIVRGPSMQIVFGFEHTILLVMLMFIAGRFALQLIELYRYEGRWDNKSLYIMYLELVHDFGKLLTYIAFFTVVVYYYFLPIYILRDLYVTGRSLYMGIQRVVQYKRATANMETKYPRATVEELEKSDAICVICREDMVAQVEPNEGLPNATTEKSNELQEPREDSGSGTGTGSGTEAPTQNAEPLALTVVKPSKVRPLGSRLKNVNIEKLLDIDTTILDDESSAVDAVAHITGDEQFVYSDKDGIENGFVDGESAEVNPKMIPRKLRCGHIFHTACLKSWLERQQSCPTCRRSVLEMEKEEEEEKRREERATRMRQEREAQQSFNRIIQEANTLDQTRLQSMSNLGNGSGSSNDIHLNQYPNNLQNNRNGSVDSDDIPLGGLSSHIRGNMRSDSRARQDSSSTVASNQFQPVGAYSLWKPGQGSKSQSNQGEPTSMLTSSRFVYDPVTNVRVTPLSFASNQDGDVDGLDSDFILDSQGNRYVVAGGTPSHLTPARRRSSVGQVPRLGKHIIEGIANDDDSVDSDEEERLLLKLLLKKHRKRIESKVETSEQEIVEVKDPIRRLDELELRIAALISETRDALIKDEPTQ